MFDPEENSISVSEGTDPTEQMQRGMAGWWLNTISKLAAEGKQAWATETLQRIYRWYGLHPDTKLLNSSGKPTETYYELQEVFSSTFIAWLVDGRKLPEVAVGLGELLRGKYSSATEVSGAKLNDAIRPVFYSMLQLGELDQSDTIGQVRTATKSAIKSPKTKVKKRSAIQQLLGVVIGFRTDLLGRLRFVVAPLLLPTISEILNDDGGTFDWDSLFYNIGDIFEYSGVVVGSIALFVMLSLAWLISGSIEGIVRWVLFGRSKTDG